VGQTPLELIKFEDGQKQLSALEMNSIVDNLARLKRLFSMAGEANLIINHDGILVTMQPDDATAVVGVIVCAGPGGEDHNPNPTDNTYWVESATCEDTNYAVPMTLTRVDILLEVTGKIEGEFVIGDEVTQAAVSGTATGTVEGVFLDEDDHDNDLFLVRRTDGDFIVSATISITGDGGYAYPTDMTSSDLFLATNIGENIGTHLLPVGQPVEVSTITDLTEPPRRRSFFTLLPLAMAVYIGYAGSACASQPTDGHASFYAGSSEGRLEELSRDAGAIVRDHAIFQNKLYAAIDATFDGDRVNIAWWNDDSEMWEGSEIPEIATIHTMLVKDDHLYVGGIATSGNGLKSVQRFNGETWTILTFPAASGAFDCQQMLVWNDEIYACGIMATGGFTKGAARLIDTTWSTLGSGLGDEFGGCFALCLEVHDDGSGEKLYVGGDFDQANGAALSVQNIAAWDGSTWSNPGGGIAFTGVGGVYALRSYDDGDGSLLYAGGQALSQWTLLAWTGQAWIPAGELLTVVVGDVIIYSMDVYVGRLIIGGHFHRTGGIPNGPPFLRVAKYDDASGLYEEMSDGFDDTAYALGTSATEPVAVGRFLHSGTNERQHAAQWNGTSWIQMGENTISGPVFAIATLGGDTFVGGDFLRLDLPDGEGSIQAKRLAKYDGEWSAVGDFNGPIYGMAVDPVGGKLYPVGQFDIAGGAAGNLCVVEWDGSVWNTICSAIVDTPTGFPRLRAAYFDVVSEDLYVAGRFTSIDGVAAINVARYDGTWHALGGGVDAEALSIEKYSGKWYFGGEFTSIDGGTASAYIARWTGSAWEAASTFNAASFLSPVSALRLVDSKLWAGTLWDATGGVFYVVRRYDDPNWSTVAGAGGRFSNDILDILDTGGGNAIICGKFTPQSDHEKAMVLLAQLDKTGMRSIGGGVGVDPIGGPVGLDSGEVYSVRSLQEPGRRCSTLFVGGAISLRSNKPARGMCGLSTRGLVPLQGGFDDGRSDFVLGAKDFLREGVRVLVVGNFTACYNDLIAPDDVGVVEPTEVSYYAAWWDGKYWVAAATGLNTVPSAVVKYKDEYYVCGIIGFVPMKSVDAETDTWSVVDADFGGGGEHWCMQVFEELLFIGGNMFVAPSGNQQIVTYDGTTITDVSPYAAIDIRRFVLAEFDNGEELYCCGQMWDGTPIRRWTGGAFVDVAAGCTGSANWMTYVPDDTSPCIIICGHLIVGGVECSMAKWDGTGWTQLGSVTGSPVPGNAYAVHHFNGQVYLLGGFPSITDPNGVHDTVLTPNLAVWTPGGWWEASPAGGLNGLGLGAG
jgi:hypothetical protein